jgi:hypothetical protein
MTKRPEQDGIARGAAGAQLNNNNRQFLPLLSGTRQARRLRNTMGAPLAMNGRVRVRWQTAERAELQNVMSENDGNQRDEGTRSGRRAIRTGLENERANRMLVSQRRPSQCGRTLRLCVAAAFATVLSGGIIQVLPWGLSAEAKQSGSQSAGSPSDQPDSRLEDETVSFSVDALPPRETYVAMQRIRYPPGAHLAEQPSDGPKLLNVLSGVLTFRTPVSGVTLARPSAGGTWTTSIEPGVDQLVTSGMIVMIPAGTPAQLSNTSDMPVEWIQFQIETPATLCACGEDRSAIDMELLSSQTLTDPFLPPAIVSLTRQRLDPAVGISSPSSGTIQLIAAVDDDETLLRGDDGWARNDGRVPIEVVVATIVSADTTG